MRAAPEYIAQAAEETNAMALTYRRRRRARQRYELAENYYAPNRDGDISQHISRASFSRRASISMLSHEPEARGARALALARHVRADYSDDYQQNWPFPSSFLFRDAVDTRRRICSTESHSASHNNFEIPRHHSFDLLYFRQML